MKLDIFFKVVLTIIFFIIAVAWMENAGWLYAITWASIAGGFATFTTYASDGWEFQLQWFDTWLSNFMVLLGIGVALDGIFWAVTLGGWL